MAGLETITGEDCEVQQPFGVRYIAALLVNSFRFSQGSQSLQEPILKYLAVEFREYFTEENIVASLEPATKLATEIRLDPTRHAPPRMTMSKEIAEEEVQTEVARHNAKLLEYVKIDIATVSTSFTLGEIARGIMDRENAKLAKGRKRQITSHATTFSDPHLSHWVYFGLMGQRTGLPEYDQLFRDLVSDYNSHKGYTEEFVGLNRDIVIYHCRHHPDQLELLKAAPITGNIPEN